MIRLSLSVTSNPIPELTAFAEQMAQTVKSIGQDVVGDITQGALSDLQRTPGKAHKPVIWQSEKQRRAYFATNGFGRGIPTRRTGKVQAGWRVDYLDAGDGFSIAIRNVTPYAKFVYGSLAQDGSGLRFQQKQHRATGWQEGEPIVQFWLDRAVQDFKERYADAIGDFGTASTSRRAYTS